MCIAKLVKIILIFLQSQTALRVVLAQQPPIVCTNLGEVSGRQYVAPRGTRVNAYLNVPYADAPVRFARPVPKAPWAPNVSFFPPSPIKGQCPSKTAPFYLLVSAIVYKRIIVRHGGPM